MAVDKKYPFFGMPYVTLGSVLLNYVFRYVMMLSTMQLNLLSKIPGYGTKAELASTVEDAVGERNKRIKKSQLVEKVFVAPTFLFWGVSLALFYPVFLIAATIRALYRRFAVGTPATFFKTDMQGPYARSPDYPCQFVFTKPFEPAKLKSVLFQMAAEAELPDDMVLLEFPDEDTGSFPTSAAVAADHYITGGDRQIGPETNLFSARMASYATSGAALVLRCYNGAPGKPTVWAAYMPGGAWDGSSCFNFLKELVLRYYGGAPNPVFACETLTLRDDAAEKLEQTTNFAQFMKRMPGAILSNMSDFMWQFYRAQPMMGGPGLLPRVNVLNFDEDMSTLIAAGAKAHGAKPYAAFVWAVANAFKSVLGYYPYGVIQQSSLQTRAYEPIVKERNLVGDWLIGPFRYLRTVCELTHSPFTLAMSQRMYDSLMDELGHGVECGSLDGAVGWSCEAKHYGLINWGAAVFEFFPFYPNEIKIMDSLFLNNYGEREIHADSGFVSYNWAAPTGIAFNTMRVNGKTCSAFGTSVHSQDELDAIRDEAERLLLSLTASPEIL